ncbi:MAG: M48 family metallopeptidase [archaeon]
MAKLSFQDQISRNKRDSTILAVVIFLVLFALIYVIARIFFGAFSTFFLVVAIALIIPYIYVTYNFGDQVVLSATNAVQADPQRDVYLVNTVEGLSIAAGVPPPKVYIVQSSEINAFATGKDPEHASIAVTTGALQNLRRDELEGVVAHEISHVRNLDTRFMTEVAVMVGLIAILSHGLLRSYWFSGSGRRSDRDRERIGIFVVIGLVLAVVSPIIVRLVQSAISRRRELLADSSSVELTRYPEGLALALEKILKMNRGNMNVSEGMSHLFFVDPNSSPLDALYATHPPLERRIQILRSM